MIASVIRVLAGFVVACLAAGLTMVLFVYTPAQIVTELAGDQTPGVLLQWLGFFIRSAMFAAPFASIAVAYGEWRGVGSWLFYAIVAIVIAGIGFLAHVVAETGLRPTIVNGYAATAFAVTGLVAGLVYWLCAGRFAADRGQGGAHEIIPPPASQAQQGTPEGPSARVAIWKTAI